MSEDRAPAGSLSIIHGSPLIDEPGLGTLTLPGFLKDVVARYADREALVMRQRDGLVRWSYADLWHHAMKVARALVAIDVGKDSRVGVLITNRPEWLSSVFGTWLAGATAVPLSTFSTPDELDYLLKASSVSAVIFEKRVVKRDFQQMILDLEPAIADAMPGRIGSPRFPFLRHLVVVDGPRQGAIEELADFLARGDATPPSLVEARAASVQPADIGALFFSSGSTALPKGIMNSQRGIAIQFWRWARMSALHDDVRAWAPNGFFWSGNCASVMGATLACGGSLVLQSTFVPSEALDLMETQRVNFPTIWPHQAKLLEEASNWANVDLGAMKYLDPTNPISRHPTVSLGPWEEARWCYGSTETFTITTGFASGTPQFVTGDSKGEALPGNTIRIVDPINGETLPRGERGEIAVKGPTLMLGYLGLPSEKTFDCEGFYRTGDGGYIDDLGRLFFEGRLTTVIKTGGANVSPLEIDQVLETFPGVKAARAVGVPHDLLGEMVVACIVPNDGAQVDGTALIAFAKQRLASYKLPRQILFFREDELPLTGSAKIKSAELRQLATERVAAALAVAIGLVGHLEA